MPQVAEEYIKMQALSFKNEINNLCHLLQRQSCPHFQLFSLKILNPNDTKPCYYRTPKLCQASGFKIFIKLLNQVHAYLCLVFRYNPTLRDSSHISLTAVQPCIVVIYKAIHACNICLSTED